MENTTDALLALAELSAKLARALAELELRVRILEGNEP
jgi:hypothetical protein